MVNDISKITRCSLSVVRDDASYYQDELALSMKSLECLARLIQSLVLWCKNIMPKAFFADEQTEIIEEMNHMILQSGDHALKTTTADVHEEQQLSVLEFDDNPDQFLEKMHFKKALERGLALFNLHPEKVKRKKKGNKRYNFT
jgi:hypothetical protein